MQNAPTRTVFNLVTDFLASEPSSQEIIDYFLPDDLQARLIILWNLTVRVYLPMPSVKDTVNSSKQIVCFRYSKPR